MSKEHITQEEIDKWYRHEIFSNRNLYPNLYYLEVKRNRYRTYGRIF